MYSIGEFYNWLSFWRVKPVQPIELGTVQYVHVSNLRLLDKANRKEENKNLDYSS
jgi:hypothetical protein